MYEQYMSYVKCTCRQNQLYKLNLRLHEISMSRE